MLALEVYVNGKRRCLAGVAEDGVVSAILTCLAGRDRPTRGLPTQDVSLHVGGLDSVRRQHMDWLRQDLTAGDDVRIRVVEVLKVDRPISGSLRPAGDITRRVKKYVRQKAKQFGWKIVSK